MYERTAGSWAWPLFFGGIGWISLAVLFGMFGAQLWLLALALAAVLLWAVGITNLLLFVGEQSRGALRELQAARAITPDAEIFKAARDLAAQCPEMAGELAKRYGRPDLILLPQREGKRAQIVLAGSDVTLQFAVDALNKSDDRYLCAMRHYLDGTYHYDANREICDRQQWKAFNFMLARDGICTRYVEGQTTNQAPMWLPPWNPDTVLRNWLLPETLKNVLRPLVSPAEDENRA